MSHKKLAIRALMNMRGDDTARARAAFRFLTPAQMKEQHGQSGMTRAELLALYEKSDAEIDAAIDWVRNQPEVTP